MELREIQRLVQIAREAGFSIEEWDYGWGTCAYNGKVNMIISEVYRPDRDGYSGGRVVSEDVLRDWIKANSPSKKADG